MRRRIVGLVVGLCCGVALGGCFRTPPQLFKRNAELKAQGYYMAEFEFKMMAALDALNRGHYWQSYRILRRVTEEMETLEGLVKMPQQASDDQLIEFLLARQDAETGAFMDPSYPFFTYIGPTANALDQLAELSARTGRPLRVEHPLRFLDEIRTPQELRAYLDSFLYIPAERFGAPAPYVAAVSEFTGPTLEQIEGIGGYPLSPEWKEALAQWFYETQDPASGFWGARLGDAQEWTQTHDIDSTAHILKHFLDERGQARDPRYPLRYAGPLAESLLAEAARGLPDDAGAAEQHEWSLRQAHAAKILTRWLWPALPEPVRERALREMPRWLEARFATYRPASGGFAAHADSAEADIDATTTALALLSEVGYVPGTWKRQRLRGPALAATPALVRAELGGWDEARVPATPAVNSWRVYAERLPADESLDDETLVGIVYPRATRIRDLQDLRRGLTRYLASAGGEFGNWTTKASLRDEPLALDRPARPVPTTQGPLDLGAIAGEHPGVERFFVLGLDAFQVPVFRGEFALAARQ